MEQVIITVNRAGETQEIDLLVQPDMPISRLVSYIAEGLHWNKDNRGQAITYDVEAIPPGRILNSHETLASVEAWDGARLVFYPVPKPPEQSPKASPANIDDSKPILQPSSESPIVGRRGIKAPDRQTGEDSPAGSPGYTLKQIDDD